MGIFGASHEDILLKEELDREANGENHRYVAPYQLEEIMFMFIKMMAEKSGIDVEKVLDSYRKTIREHYEFKGHLDLWEDGVKKGRIKGGRTVD